MSEEGTLFYARIVSFLIVLGFIVLFWMVSTAKRIKKGGLFKNTILYAVISYICQIFLGLRIVWKFLALLLIYLFIMMFSISEQEYLPLVLRTIVVCAYMLWWLIKADEIKAKTAKTAKGDLSAEIDTNLMPNSLKQHAENINSIQDGIRLAVEKEMKSEHLKTELITNVSHDIKTPLTSIINYVDLLQKEHTEEEEAQYLEVLSRQSDRLKKLIEDLIEASKASTGNINVELTKINVNEILNQSLSEYEEKLQEKGLDVIVTTPEKGCYVMADGNLFWRILNNLYNNIYKYALPNTRVYIDVDKVDEDVRISIKNISKEKLNISSDELMERFVRGDSSRHTEGSGLGLNIARSLADIQHGSLDLFIDGDLFKIELRLPEA
jgi:signal transduction histidine kinase